MQDKYKPIKLILALLVLVLIGGSFGFWAIEGWSLLDALYMTVITITTVGYGEVQVLSAAGRVFAMIVIASGIGVAGLAASELASFMVSRELNGTLRKRRITRLIGAMNGHCVVCGFGSDAQAFCRSMLNEKRSFVVLTASDDAYDLALSFGYLVLGGERDLSVCFGMARLSHAANVVVMLESDRETLSSGLLVHEYLQAAVVDGIPPSVCLRLQDPTVYDLCKSSGMIAVNTAPLSLNPFSVAMNMVRLIYHDHPMELLNDGLTLGDEVHVVLPSLDAFGTAFMVYSGLVGHYRGGIKTHTHVVNPTAEKQVSRFLKQYPGYEKCAHLHAYAIDDADDYVEAVYSLLSGLPEKCAFSVFLPEGDELLSFKYAVSLSERMQSHPGARILVWPVSDSPITRQMVAASQYGRISLLPTLEDACGVEPVLLESLDIRAKAIHAEWFAEEDARAKKRESAGNAYKHKPSHKPWHELTEEQKDANRLQADHISIKIRAAGFTQELAKSAEAWTSLPSADMDALAEMEHERWCADKYMSGWQHSTSRDDTQKLHPDLIPYADLDEPTKQYDRDTLLKLHRYLS